MTLSTHVLDATTGRPAAGVQVRLDSAAGAGGADAGWVSADQGQTDADGRLRLSGPGGTADFEPGVYRITFGTGAYFTARGVPSFYPEVTITLDRKSTRLNSSHMSISYAVFRLKKKKDFEAEVG